MWITNSEKHSSVLSWASIREPSIPLTDLSTVSGEVVDNQSTDPEREMEGAAQMETNTIGCKKQCS